MYRSDSDNTCVHLSAHADMATAQSACVCVCVCVYLCCSSGRTVNKILMDK